MTDDSPKRGLANLVEYQETGQDQAKFAKLKKRVYQGLH